MQYDGELKQSDLYLPTIENVLLRVLHVNYLLLSWTYNIIDFFICVEL